MKEFREVVDQSTDTSIWDILLALFVIGCAAKIWEAITGRKG